MYVKYIKDGYKWCFFVNDLMLIIIVYRDIVLVGSFMYCVFLFVV